MARTLLYILLLIMAPGDSAAKSEMCRSWMFGIKSGFGPFRCPKENGDPAARFCCGTCRRPYCCAWQADRLDQEHCLDSGELQNYLPLEELEGAPSVPWNYFWLLPIGLGIALLCLSLSMIVPHLKNHVRSLNCRTTSREELVAPGTVHHALKRTALDLVLTSSVTCVPCSQDACVDADPPCPGAEGLQGTPEVPPGSSNPPKMPSDPPGSGTHVVETVILSPAKNPLGPSLKQTLIAESSF